jgi:hypothetical protein
LNAPIISEEKDEWAKHKKEGSNPSTEIVNTGITD